MLIRIVRGCYVRGQPRSEGETLDVDPSTLLDLIACGAGQALDPGDVRRAADAVHRHMAAQLARNGSGPFMRRFA